MATTIDQQFVEYIVKSLVGKPDDVKVDRRIDEKGVLLELIVDPEDLGRVIGKRGSTAQSIRTLLRALGTKNDARYNLKIVDTGPPPSRAQEGAEAKAEKKVEKEEPAPTADLPTEDSVKVDEPVRQAQAKPADQPAATDDVDMTEEEELPEKPAEDHSDVISRTRKELADLDDLDV